MRRWILPFAVMACTVPAAAAEPGRAPYQPPNLNPTQIPSALVAEWGNYFVSASAYAYDNGSGNGRQAYSVDGSVNVGVGFGSARHAVAVELDYNQESVANVANGGSLDVRLGRELISTDTFNLHLGGGWLGVASFGPWPKPGGSPYGVLTAAWPLRPRESQFRQTMQVNLGAGSGRFQRIDAVNLISDGVLASVGVELTPNLGISTGWAGKGVNASLSYVPLRATPLYLSLSGANLTNVDGTGRAVALSLSWGGTFRTVVFPAP